MKRILLVLTVMGMLSNPMFANTPGMGKISRHHHNREKVVQANGDVVKINYKNDGRIEKTYRNGKLINEKRFYDNGSVRTVSSIKSR